MSKPYPESLPQKHATVRLPKEMVAAIEDFLKTDAAKKMGFLHITDVATEAVRELLKARGYFPQVPMLEHYNLSEYGVTILDRSLDPPKGRLVEVYFKPALDNTLMTHCGHDDTDKCSHVDFALELPEVQEILRKKGWKLQ